HRLDLGEHAQPEGEPRVDAGRGAADVPGPHEQPVRGDLRVDGVFAQRAQEQGGHPQHAVQPSGPAIVHRSAAFSPTARCRPQGCARRRGPHVVVGRCWMQGTMAAGWYRDPEGRAPTRWWDGVWWTAWESDG